MNITIYTLNPDGTIPSHVIDGGYFPKPNGGKSPQDYDFIGISTEPSSFNNKAQFVNHIKGFFSDYTLEEFPNKQFKIKDDIDNIWSKL